MSNEKMYAKRNPEALDKAGDYYIRHVSAMTREDLHSKSAIAAELAYRDWRIAELEARERELVEAAFREGHLTGRCGGTTNDEDDDCAKYLAKHKAEKDGG